ncbi:MAG: Bro-N domain-containing protein [Enterococcus canintestini]|uniref:BRO-N domain-containing protein n=1 Tax=Enterococcus canintestini TaxID=317010 RepID=UPI002ECBC4C0|nr:phage repressor protein [Enterococcus hirae]EMF0159266.1 phage repressor protein [Enterococcus hirae]
MKTENWNGHEIRFVNINDEWWAVAKDVAEALGYPETNAMTKRLEKSDLMSDKLSGMNMKSVLVNEFGIYDAVFGSHKKEAKEFKRWIFDIIKELRQSTGLEGFQVFRMLDKEHQKSAMQNLKKSLRNPVRVDFIKANVIANKAVSNKHGFPKMIKKAEMTPDMLVERQEILDSTVELMGIKDRYGLKLSVSEEIYASLEPQNQTA